MFGRGKTAAALVISVTMGACASGGTGSSPVTVQPGAPGEPTRPVAAQAGTTADEPGHTEADTRFMQHMIAHHAQALRMTSLVPERTDDEALNLISERIEVSQADEIRLMQRWLRTRGEEAPTVDESGMVHGLGLEHAHMTGMLTPEQMSSLREASGDEFERLFLELMIQHHEGALTMVDRLFAAEGAAQEPTTYEIASEIVATQMAEIQRMQQMLEARSE